MDEWIGEYRILTPMKTAGSGSARWCFASKGLKRFFLKEFLSPVWPANEESIIGQRQKERCEYFEQRKKALYAAMSCVIGETLVPVIDFFRSGNRYYAVSEAMTDRCISAEEVMELSDEEKRRLLFDTALCLQRLHMQGIVHADLKPEHVLLTHRPDGWIPRLIDLDSGFLMDSPPIHAREMEGDPAFLAPEAFLCMAGERAELGTALDSFAFGAMIHRIWTGKMPGFDHERCSYLYEAALQGVEIQMAEELPEEYHVLVKSLLHVQPQKRPSDAQILLALDTAPVRSKRHRSEREINGLGRLMRS